MRRTAILPLALLLLAPSGQAFHWDDVPVLAAAEAEGPGWVAWRVRSLDAATFLEIEVDERGDAFALGVYVISASDEPTGLTMWGISQGSGTRVGSSLVGGDVVVVGADGSGTSQMGLGLAAYSPTPASEVEREIVLFLSGDVAAWRATLRDPGATTLLDAASGPSAFYLDLESSPALVAAQSDAEGSRAGVALQAEAVVEAEGRFFGSVGMWSDDYVCAGACLGMSRQGVSARTPDGTTYDCASAECSWFDAGPGAYAFRADSVELASGAWVNACLAQTPQCAEMRGGGTSAVFLGADVRTPW